MISKTDDGNFVLVSPEGCGKSRPFFFGLGSLIHLLSAIVRVLHG